MKSTVVVRVDARGEQDFLLAPKGLDTPHELCLGVEIESGICEDVVETNTGQTLLKVRPGGDEVVFRYAFDRGAKDYPDRMFEVHSSRFTRAAEALIDEACNTANALSGNARIEAIACATAERFTYGHPKDKFNDGYDEVPALGCGIAEGSCIDINTYFIASLRCAGFEAGYLTGYFFPEEKGGRCDDAHCWVVTRHDGEILEWDIAHHLKLGTREIRAGLNPKPGVRHTVAHSMGLDIPALSILDMKLISQPVWVAENGKHRGASLSITRE